MKTTEAIILGLSLLALSIGCSLLDHKVTQMEKRITVLENKK